MCFVLYVLKRLKSMLLDLWGFMCLFKKSGLRQRLGLRGNHRKSPSSLFFTGVTLWICHQGWIRGGLGWCQCRRWLSQGQRWIAWCSADRCFRRALTGTVYKGSITWTKSSRIGSCCFIMFNWKSRTTWPILAYLGNFEKTAWRWADVSYPQVIRLWLYCLGPACAVMHLKT